ncbi:hypothetical protein [Kitasatospora phosalacinea]|uniref:hypothetical protein n=1 Tax=Kitasatospora phosalacinea TaxID=2065 RepID=UPI0005269408|nr:hypothetical protein [Kitasatospora phosalacinea]
MTFSQPMDSSRAGTPPPTGREQRTLGRRLGITPLRTAQERVNHIAAELNRLTGDRPSVTWGDGGVLRVSVRVLGLHDAELATTVLAVLGQGDRYGHRRTALGEYVWAEIGGKRVTDPNGSRK